MIYYFTDDIDYLYSLDVNKKGEITETVEDPKQLAARRAVKLLTEQQKRRLEETKRTLNSKVMSLPPLFPKASISNDVGVKIHIIVMLLILKHCFLEVKKHDTLFYV